MATRQEICDALKAQLSTIRVVNGYSTDVGQQVMEWSGVLVEPKTDCIIFGDSDESFDEENHRINCRLTVEIQATLFTVDHAVQARKALADMLKAIYKSPSLGLRGVKTTVIENSIDTDDSGRDLVFVYVKAQVSYYLDI